jgi:hypothetical protein
MPDLDLRLTIPTEDLTIVAALPETLSQRNVESVTGIPASAYLRAIALPGFPLSVTRLGKLRLVDRAGFVAWLRSGASMARELVGPANDAPDLEESLLEKLGLEHAPPGVRRRGGRG